MELWAEWIQRKDRWEGKLNIRFFHNFLRVLKEYWNGQIPSKNRIWNINQPFEYFFNNHAIKQNDLNSSFSIFYLRFGFWTTYFSPSYLSKMSGLGYIQLIMNPPQKPSKETYFGLFSSSRSSISSWFLSKSKGKSNALTKENPQIPKNGQTQIL